MSIWSDIFSVSYRRSGVIVNIVPPNVVWQFQSGSFSLAVSVWQFQSGSFSLAVSVWQFQSPQFSLAVWQHSLAVWQFHLAVS